MAKNERAMLQLLKDELTFLEQGSSKRSVRTTWIPESGPQDSNTCVNYYEPARTSPCSECLLIDFVAHEHHSEEVPCHFITLNDAGETIEGLEAQGNQARMETTLKEWLRTKIRQIEDETANPEARKRSAGWR